MSLLSIVLLASASRTTLANASPTDSGAPVPQASSGFETFTLDTEYQAAPVQVEVLLPDNFDARRTYPVLYILPVVAHGSAFGYGLTEARKADIANKYGLICVYPSFTNHPWFGNNATNPQDQQDDYMVKALVPFIDGKFPTQPSPEGRWLLGFSKSGWGAFTLLLRHPTVFGYAAAWDSPFMLNGNNSGEDWGPMGLKENMGTKENMKHFLPTQLAADNAEWLKRRTRLVVGCGDYWKTPCEQMHAFLEQHGVPHTWLPELQLPHRWDSGWFAPTVDALVLLVRASGPVGPAPGKPL